MTGWAPKVAARKWKLVVGGLVVLAVIVLGVRLRMVPVGTVRFGTSRLRLETVTTPEAQSRGLGGRTSLAADQGMLFVFHPPTQECFWMKDMHFPIDIIWINSAKKIIKLTEHVSPDTYPETFCPDTPAAYVLETNPGAARAAGLGVGSVLALP